MFETASDAEKCGEAHDLQLAKHQYVDPPFISTYDSPTPAASACSIWRLQCSSIDAVATRRFNSPLQICIWTVETSANANRSRSLKIVGHCCWAIPYLLVQTTPSLREQKKLLNLPGLDLQMVSYSEVFFDPLLLLAYAVPLELVVVLYSENVRAVCVF